MKSLALLLFLFFSRAAFAGNEVAKRCLYLMGKYGKESGDSFAGLLAAETNKEVRDYALIIHDDIDNHGAFTEMGAHGKGLSWKWLGVSKEKEAEADKYKVVGYANFQYFMAPYAELARQGKVQEVAIGSNLNHEVFIDGTEFGKLPLGVQQNIIKAIRMNLNPERVRVYQASEAAALFRDGTLPQVNCTISRVRAGKGEEAEEGVSLFTMSRVSAAKEDAEDVVPFQIDPTQPVIIGRQNDSIPPYLDPNYMPTNIGPTGKKVTGHANDGALSRAHFMLEGIVGKGIQVVNGVPGVDGKLRSPLNGTWISLAGKPERFMEPKEKVLIPTGSYAIIRLPNGSKFRVDAPR